MKLSRHTGAQQMVKEALESGLHLTNQTCFHKMHTTELRKIISRLREKGMNIKTYQIPGYNYLHYYLFKECDKIAYSNNINTTFEYMKGIKYNTYKL